MKLLENYGSIAVSAVKNNKIQETKDARFDLTRYGIFTTPISKSGRLHMYDNGLIVSQLIAIDNTRPRDLTRRRDTARHD